MGTVPRAGSEADFRPSSLDHGEDVEVWEQREAEMSLCCPQIPASSAPVWGWAAERAGHESPRELWKFSGWEVTDLMGWCQW